ncbi:hypothetical protein F5148DRAFT_1277388 [Russula earlei]|uniref:Uncharacterized protein n=1 Tax=Russula earlei TaxID=71964 RepID=A0ACC0TZA9_9AGAM|nr:hypothetical protein F5148DRAFT_1277388 [Russula earlei]
MCGDSRSSRKYVFFFLDRANYVMVALTASAILYTHSVGVVYFCAGAVACTVSVKCVKQILRQARPVQTTNREQKQSFGMPSTHSAAITFFGTYIPLACTWLPLHTSFPKSPLFRCLVVLVTVPWTVAVARSRILLGHHTAPQVIVGCVYGFSFACIWFWLWVHGLNDWGQRVERYFGVYIR